MGFEPTVGYQPTTVFKTAALSRSAIPPNLCPSRSRGAGRGVAARPQPDNRISALLTALVLGQAQFIPCRNKARVVGLQAHGLVGCCIVARPRPGLVKGCTQQPVDPAHASANVEGRVVVLKMVGEVGARDPGAEAPLGNAQVRQGVAVFVEYVGADAANKSCTARQPSCQIQANQGPQRQSVKQHDNRRHPNPEPRSVTGKETRIAGKLMMGKVGAVEL